MKRKALTEFSCPYCKTANSVHVRMKKDGSKQQATCLCTQCEKQFNIKDLSLLQTAKNAYMAWVTYVNEMKKYAVECQFCREKCLLQITNHPSEGKCGCLQCPQCNKEYYFRMDPNETREQLAIRINQHRISSFQEVVIEQTKSRRQLQTQEESSEEQPQEKQVKTTADRSSRKKKKDYSDGDSDFEPQEESNDASSGSSYDDKQ